MLIYMRVRTHTHTYIYNSEMYQGYIKNKMHPEKEKKRCAVFTKYPINYLTDSGTNLLSP